jgi:hypothetical protein
MTTTQKTTVRNLKTAANELRYAGYNARADYQMCQVTIKGIDDNEWRALQARYSVCLMRGDA